MSMDERIHICEPGVYALGGRSDKKPVPGSKVLSQAAGGSGWRARVSTPGKARMTGRAAAVLGSMIASLALGFFSLSGQVMAADAERGGLLYETRCKACHEDSVHNRKSRKAESFAALRAQVLRWSAEAGGVWTAEEIDNVARYLNERYYRFPCPQVMCKAEQAWITR